MPKAEVTLPAMVSSVPTARHFVESILAGWGLEEIGWTATLVVSELAANAALHARGESFAVHIATQADSSVLLEVADGSLRLPQQRSYSSDATTGRGLRLVNELADDWGVHSRNNGKTIWALIRPSSAPESGRDDPDEDTLLSAFGDDDVVPIQEGRTGPSARFVARLLVAA
jgi:anti-sigma regulatory factor (Ser/Thr protein kinase)